jgi:hypothetical protein
MDCKKRGSFFSGMGEAACRVQGGTFCPVADCSDLKVCVARLRDHNNRAFAQYVNASPNIGYPKDPFQCGRAREYFGFQENFINDEQICEDIEQLTLTRDFAILDTFFNQGDSGGGGVADAPVVPGLDLVPPKLSTLWPVSLHLCCDFKLTP